MFATKFQRVAMSSASRKLLAPMAFRYNISTPSMTVMFQRGFATDNNNNNTTGTKSNLAQFFSTMAENPRGFVERPLQVLDMNVVRKIKAELMEVDANSDGR